MTERPLLVQATKTLFYRSMRIKPGTRFSLDDPKDFSPSGMEWAPTDARDDLAAAVDASPKTRGDGGLTMKQKRPGSTTMASLKPDPGI